MGKNFALTAWLRPFKGTTFYRTIKNSSTYSFFKDRQEEKRARAFFEQRPTSITVGNFNIEVPDKHPLIDWQLSQPYRDQHIGIAAGLFARKYPSAMLIDIGANVGDSAAWMASRCPNDLVLIEPSPFYIKYLKKNAALFPNKTVVQQVLIGSAPMTHGDLVHHAGTAYYESGKLNGPKRFVTKQLSDFQGDICLVKCDTDGYDFTIVNENISWLAAHKPGAIIEIQIRTKTNLDQANEVFANLMSIGYVGFIFFDDPGFMVLGTDSLEQINELNRYQFKLFEREEHRKSIWNFDVLCCHNRDADVFDAVRTYYHTY